MKTLTQRRQITGSIIPTFLMAFAACSTHTTPPQAPIVQGTRISPSGMRPSVASLDGSTVAQIPTIQVEATVNKEAVLSQEFLYSSDLQYSTIFDKGMDLTNQSLALGIQVVRFRIAGNELQLVADNKIHSKSDVNHPEVLLSRFKILSQTETTLTISSADSRASLSQIMAAIAGTPAEPAQDLWVRSFEFVPNGNYLLQETSVMLADGTIGEFMEAIFPRESMKPSKNFEAIEMNPESDVGGDEGAVARYRFLTGDKIFKGEKALSYAQHFDLPEGAAIEWYATRNIPDEMIDPVAQAIEGWNRYFTHFKGIERKVMVFKGRLPEGVHLGDPRYNVINWDSRLVAGAAYESQDSDPVTGKQSHSMIYMPAAWVQIGTDYWTKGQLSDTQSTLNLGTSNSARFHKAVCARDMKEAAALMASGRFEFATSSDIKNFGIQLLKQTLFHEVGHALGLAHNFKGSLSYDRANPKSLFSTSIMDYNDFEIERAAFSAVNSADGPVLEYDRQALSALYNTSKDVASSDAVLPACNDAEADSEIGGVDPLCIRYDIENDPTLSVETSYNRLIQETLVGDVSLAQAISRVPEMILGLRAESPIKTKSDLNARVTQIGNSIRGIMNYYVISGKAAFGRSVQTNLKSLLEFSEDVLPEGYNASQMRARALAGFDHAINLKTLPVAVKTSLKRATDESLKRLAKSDYFSTLSMTEAALLITQTRMELTQAIDSFENDTLLGLPRLRAAALGALARRPNVPYYLGEDQGKTLDIEAALIEILSAAIPADSARTGAERTKAASALATYANRSQGDDAIAAVLKKLAIEQSQTKKNADRELVQSLISILKSAK